MGYYLDAEPRQLALIICDITEANLQPCEFESVQNGSSNPHDLFDANVALYGAWAGLFFEPPDLDRDSVCEALNEAQRICVALGYNRAAISATLYGN